MVGLILIDWNMCYCSYHFSLLICLILTHFTFNIFTIIVPPSVIGPNPENLTVVVNNFISLTCEVSGFPPPDLSWLKNEQPIRLNTNAFIVPGKELSTLLK